MWELRTLVVLCATVAMVACALASGASAQWAYECAPAGGGSGFKDAHCKDATASGAKFNPVVPPKGSTPVAWSNETTGGARSTWKLKLAVLGGALTLELQSTEVEGEGELENKEEGGGIAGEGFAALTFKNVTVTQPAGKGCEVVGGKLTTSKLKVTARGLTTELQLLPFEGDYVIPIFEINGCSSSAFNRTWWAKGSVKGKNEGATTTFTHAATTAQKTLLLTGAEPWGLEGSLTIKRNSTGNGIVFT